MPSATKGAKPLVPTMLATLPNTASGTSAITQCSTTRMHENADRNQILGGLALRAGEAPRRDAERHRDQHHADHFVLDEGPEQAVRECCRAAA